MYIPFPILIDGIDISARWTVWRKDACYTIWNGKMPWERIVVPGDDKEWRTVFRFLRKEAETSLLPFWDAIHLLEDGDLLARFPVTQEIELEEDAEYRKESKDEDWGCFLGSLHEPFYEERDDE